MRLNFIPVKDIVKFAEFTSAIWHEYWPCLLSESQINYMVEKFQSEKAICEQIEKEDYVYFYIMSDEDKAGYIGLSKKEDYLFLSKLYIHKDFRHKGIGTKAFVFIKNFAEENGYKRINLTVNKYNKNSIDAYLKWGFKITESVITDIGKGFVMDDYIMDYNIS